MTPAALCCQMRGTGLWFSNSGLETGVLDTYLCHIVLLLEFMSPHPCLFVHAHNSPAFKLNSSIDMIIIQCILMGSSWNVHNLNIN